MNWYRYKVYKDGKWMFNGVVYVDNEKLALKELNSRYKGENYTYQIEKI